MSADNAGARRWPFAESPGDFAWRLHLALQEFDSDLLAAVRHVLIENPPTSVAAPQPTAVPVSLCATCTHWDPVGEGDLSNEIRGSGNCLKIRHINEVTTERDHGDDEWTGELVLQPQHAGVLAVAVDGSGYRACVVTMPDFGCVLHSPKEA